MSQVALKPPQVIPLSASPIPVSSKVKFFGKLRSSFGCHKTAEDRPIKKIRLNLIELEDIVEDSNKLSNREAETAINSGSRELKTLFESPSGEPNKTQTSSVLRFKLTRLQTHISPNKGDVEEVPMLSMISSIKQEPSFEYSMSGSQKSNQATKTTRARAKVKKLTFKANTLRNSPTTFSSKKSKKKYNPSNTSSKIMFSFKYHKAQGKNFSHFLKDVQYNLQKANLNFLSPKYKESSRNRLKVPQRLKPNSNIEVEPQGQCSPIESSNAQDQKSVSPRSDMETFQDLAQQLSDLKH